VTNCAMNTSVAVRCAVELRSNLYTADCYRRRLYVGLVRMCVCGWALARKTPDRNDLKLGTVVVLDTVSMHIDFRFCQG